MSSDQHKHRTRSIPMKLHCEQRPDSADDATISAPPTHADAGAGSKVLSHRFDEFDGQYVSESLMDCLSEIEQGFNKIKDDPAYWEEYQSYYSWMGRAAD